MNQKLRRRSPGVAMSVLVLAGCGGAPPSPPILAYGQERVAAAAYAFTDSTSVNVSVMGQAMELSQNGVAEYAAVFEGSPRGVDVTLSLRSLSASLNQPLGAPVSIDESMVDGDVVFSLDRVGDATVSARPEVSDEASQMVSGLSLAHTFFPALPGTAALPGEQWVDTLEFAGEEGPGTRSESSVMTYTVVGDSVVDGRSLLHIRVAGTTTMGNEMRISGMEISQESELEVAGHVLWDLQAGIMYEQVRVATGAGAVQVPMAPVPLPIRVRSVQRARLVDE